MVRGDALVVRLPEGETWVPTSWPAAFLDLEALVRRVTSDECSVIDWLNRTFDHSAAG